MKTCVPNHSKTEKNTPKPPQLKVMTSRHRKKQPWEGRRFGGVVSEAGIAWSQHNQAVPGLLKKKQHREKKKEEKR